MARPIIWLFPGLTAFALFSGCGGASEADLFSSSGGAQSAGSSSSTAGKNGESLAGAVSTAGGGAPVEGDAGSESGGTASEGGNAAGGAASAGAPHGGAASAGAANGGSSNGGTPGAPHAGASNAGAGGSSTGSAGSPNGGAANGGSAGASGEPTCAELFALAAKQLEAARGCNIAQNIMQCTGKVENTCGCEVPVERNDSPETKAYLATQKLLDKKKCSQICPAIACTSLKGARCNAALPSTAGVCVGYGF